MGERKELKITSRILTSRDWQTNGFTSTSREVKALTLWLLKSGVYGSQPGKDGILSAVVWNHRKKRRTLEKR